MEVHGLDVPPSGEHGRVRERCDQWRQRSPRVREARPEGQAVAALADAEAALSRDRYRLVHPRPGPEADDRQLLDELHDRLETRMRRRLPEGRRRVPFTDEEAVPRWLIYPSR